MTSLSSADILYKLFGLNQAQQNVGPDLNSNYLILIVYILTNSADPDEMPPNVAFHLGDSLQKNVCSVCSNERVCRLACYMLVTTFVIC